jgi:hypothetical protein
VRRHRVADVVLRLGVSGLGGLVVRLVVRAAVRDDAQLHDLGDTLLLGGIAHIVSGFRTGGRHFGLGRRCLLFSVYVDVYVGTAGGSLQGLVPGHGIRHGHGLDRGIALDLSRSFSLGLHLSPRPALLRRRSRPLHDLPLQRDSGDPHGRATLEIPVPGLRQVGRGDGRDRGSGRSRRRPLGLEPTHGKVRQSRRTTGVGDRHPQNRTRGTCRTLGTRRTLRAHRSL